jgi:hypothetical protein
MPIESNRTSFWAPKFGNDIERSILEKYLSIKSSLGKFSTGNRNFVYYRTTGGLYWKVFTDFSPLFSVNGVNGHSTRETSLSIQKEEIIRSVIAILSSDLFWWWYTITTNCRDLNPNDIYQFPVPVTALEDQHVKLLGGSYLNDITKNSKMLVRNQNQTGRTETQSFIIQKSKHIIDEIDKVLAKHYDFTEEELDFIINYDIKYRMGKELNQ